MLARLIALTGLGSSGIDAYSLGGVELRDLWGFRLLLLGLASLPPYIILIATPVDKVEDIQNT